jgi:hypothetical protein
MFGLDDEYWKEHEEKMKNHNLRKGNVGEHPDKWGGLPAELFPGYVPSKPVVPLSADVLDGWVVPESLGGGCIGPWSVVFTDVTTEVFIFERLWVREDDLYKSWICDLTFDKSIQTISCTMAAFDQKYEHHDSGTPKSSSLSGAFKYYLDLWLDGSTSTLSLTTDCKNLCDKGLVSLLLDRHPELKEA